MNQKTKRSVNLVDSNFHGLVHQLRQSPGWVPDPLVRVCPVGAGVDLAK